MKDTEKENFRTFSLQEKGLAGLVLILLELATEHISISAVLRIGYSELLDFICLGHYRCLTNVG